MGVFICCDMKSYYASVECVYRDLDPLKANLLVADEERQQEQAEDFSAYEMDDDIPEEAEDFFGDKDNIDDYIDYIVDELKAEYQTREKR